MALVITIHIYTATFIGAIIFNLSTGQSKIIIICSYTATIFAGCISTYCSSIHIKRSGNHTYTTAIIVSDFIATYCASIHIKCTATICVYTAATIITRYFNNVIADFTTIHIKVSILQLYACAITSITFTPYMVVTDFAAIHSESGFTTRACSNSYSSAVVFHTISRTMCDISCSLAVTQYEICIIINYNSRLKNTTIITITNYLMSIQAKI